MNLQFTKPMLGFILMVLFGVATKAQNAESQITVKITKEINGETKTYEGSYENEEQMKADEELKAFIGKPDRSHFWFSQDTTKGMTHTRPPHTPGTFPQFHLSFDLGDSLGNDSFFGLPMDSAMKQLHIKMSKFIEEFDEEEMQKHLDQMRRHMKEINQEAEHFKWLNNDSIHKEIEMHMKELGHMTPPQLSDKHFKKIRITEDANEFGKMGQVKAKEQLELEELLFFPNPSPHGQINLWFRTSGNGDLSIKVFNLAGKEVFGRYFENFSGLYDESIDLSNQEEGIYLLEISQAGKRLTRKIIIN